MDAREGAVRGLVDVGANLGHDSFARDLPEVLGRARSSGVAQIVVTGASESESRRALAVAAGAGRRWQGSLFATAGVHPHVARDWRPDSATVLRELALDPLVVALGETGLDFNRDFSPRDTQISVFEQQLVLASELALPVFMHERDAAETFAGIVAEHRTSLRRAVVHCFTGERAALERYLELDLYVGITGWICDERRGRHLRELVRRVPLDRLLLETDAPYLLPRDLEPRPKSRRNEPMHLAHVARAVAECVNVTPQALAEITARNARMFFDLPVPAQGD
ncbi:MAG: TatD family hydrolase [Gammaproteobacteria bacterium]